MNYDIIPEYVNRQATLDKEDDLRVLGYGYANVIIVDTILVNYPL